METEPPTRADPKPSKACRGDVTRTATATGLTREEAEIAALDAAQKAAERACKSKDCGSGSTSCHYVENKTEGSSAPIDDARPGSPGWKATMSTIGTCACE